LLDDRIDLVASTTNHSNDRFRFSVVRYGNGNVGIPGESWFGASRNGQSPNQRERMARRGEIGADLT
jgi:hypothetical protein